MNSDLEEGEIVEDEVIEVETDKTPEWKKYINTNSTNNILLGSFGKIPKKNEKKLPKCFYSKYKFSHKKNEIVEKSRRDCDHVENCHSMRNTQNINGTANYTEKVKHGMRSGKNKRKLHVKSSKPQKDIRNSEAKMRAKCNSSSSLSDCSSSSREYSFKSHSKIKPGNQVKEYKKHRNSYGNNKRNHYRPSEQRRNRKSSKMLLGEHKKNYFSSFTESVSQNSSIALFRNDEDGKDNETLTFPNLKVTDDLIKPGSIGEMLLKRRQKKPPIEILLSDTDHPAMVEKTVLSDDEDLMILRKKALDSFNKAGNNILEGKKVDPTLLPESNQSSDCNKLNSAVSTENQSKDCDQLSSIKTTEIDQSVECKKLDPIDQAESNQTNEPEKQDSDNVLENGQLNECNKLATDENRAELSTLPVKLNLSNVPVSIEAQYEPVDMEISFSDDESNSKEKKEFPIEWAYMMPPPTSSKNNSSIQTLNRWSYDQNMCVQAMESTIKESTTCDYQSVRQTKPFHNQNIDISSKITGNVSNDDSLDDNLIGGHAKQYKAFMASFCKEQTLPNLDNKSKPTVYTNLIEVPLLPFIPESLTNSYKRSECLVHEDDEDLLLATLLIDQEKRAQKRQKNMDNQSNNIIPKKRSKNQTNFAKRLKTDSNSEGKRIDVSFSVSDDNIKAQSSNPSTLEYGRFKFPKIKPVIISLESDSENEGDNKPNCSNIDQFIRNIRNSENTRSHNPQQLNVSKTEKVLSCLSKTQQEDYKMLKERLHHKLTAKSQLSKKVILAKKNKTSATKIISPRKKVVGKFNFSMDASATSLANKRSSSLAKKISQTIVNKSNKTEFIVTSSNNNQEAFIKTDSACQSVPAMSIVSSVPLKEIVADNLPEKREPPCNDTSREVKEIQSHSATNDKCEDDENALRTFLLESLSSKNYKSTNISSHPINNTDQCETINAQSKLKCDQYPDGSYNVDDINSKTLNKTCEAETSSTAGVCLLIPKIESSSHTNDICIKQSTKDNKILPSVEIDIGEAVKPITLETFSPDNFNVTKSNLSISSNNTLHVEENFIAVNINETRLTNVINIVKETAAKAVNCGKPSFNSEVPKDQLSLSKCVGISQSRKDKVPPPAVCDKNKIEETILLKNIEQDVVKERNKVFNSRQKLTEDIKKSERYFIESKAMLSLMSNLKVQLLQAEQNYCNKVSDAEANVKNLYDKKVQLKKHINRSKELQRMGEKLGKQVIGQKYTFPPPSNNYEVQFATIESDLSVLKKRVHRMVTTEVPKSGKNVDGVNERATREVKKDAATTKKHMFKIDKRAQSDKLIEKQSIEQLKLNETKAKPTMKSFNPESCSDSNILCPHDLLGRCNDDSCIYIHLESPPAEEASRNLATPPTSVASNIIPVKNSPPVESSVECNEKILTNLEVAARSCDEIDFNSSPISMKRAVVRVIRLTDAQITANSDATSTIKSRLRKRN